MRNAPPGARDRSTASIVLSRSDPDRVEVAPASQPRRDGSWLWWIPLGGLVAGAWALLLLGDSLG